MRKNLTKLMMAALLVFPVGAALQAEAATNWDVTGTYEWSVLDTYTHDMVLTMNPDGTFIGTGGSPAGGAPYTDAHETSETITGVVVGDQITFTTTYGGPSNPGYSATVSGTIAADGSMSGNSPWEWHTTSGHAETFGTLVAEDFGVVDYNTGVTGELAGYTAGFGLVNADLDGASSVVVKLYAGDTLLQTNTAIISKFNADITGTQFSSPFDVSGSFNYALDGYWTNQRESQYGQSVPATRAVATVTLESGQVVTATNTNLTGNPEDIYPPVPPAPVKDKNACKDGGWKTFTNPSFRNQGQCVNHMNK